MDVSLNLFQEFPFSINVHLSIILFQPMIVTSTDGYILSVLGPFPADSKNNDTSLIKHCLFQNKEGILK